jgi:putative tryptophan/tyrosine transport system substrate-binding protein
MSLLIGRRAFVRAAVGVLAMARTGAAQPAARIWRIGWIRVGSPPADAVDAALRDGLRPLGFVEGANLVIDTRYAQGRPERYPAIMRELLTLKPDLLVVGGAGAIREALKATATVPIVAVDLESDPVASGFVKSLARPGGNLTGVFLDLPELAGKQLQYLRETLPNMRRVAVLWDPTVVRPQFAAIEIVARASGIALLSLPVQRSEDFDAAVTQAGRERVSALSVLTSPLFFAFRARIADLALKHHLPSISIFSVYPEAGGLMAYGPNFPDMYRSIGPYIDRIFKGTSPAELPVERPTTFELVINVKTAKALGLAMPHALLARADRVIQ